MALSWKSKKQLTYFSLALGIILFLFGTLALLIYRQFSGGDCFDGKRNQKEEGVDCGGICDPCPFNLKGPVIIWTRFFKESDEKNNYDIAAMIYNSNYNWASGEINYAVKLFDKENILITERYGKTFLNPGEQVLIFENSLPAIKATPYMAVIEINRITNWKYLKEPPPRFAVVKKKFDKSSSTLEVEIKNDNAFDLNNVFVNVVLSDKNGNAFAVSSTKIDFMATQETESAFFTWQKTFEEEPSKIEIMPRTKMAE